MGKLNTRSIWTKIDLFPPVMCALLASERGKQGVHRVLTDEEVSRRSGIPMSRIGELFFTTSWDNVTVDEMRRFTIACGIDFADRDTMRLMLENYRRKVKFARLRHHPDWPMYRKMIEKWAATMKKGD